MIDYSYQIHDATAEFLSLDDNQEQIYNPKSHKFQALCKFIYTRIFRPSVIKGNGAGPTGKRTILDLNDIETINGIWETYSALCGRFQVAPTLIRFSILTGIGKDSLSRWASGTVRTSEHKAMVNAWKEENEAFLVDQVTDSNSIGSIFLLKSDYSYRDNSTIEIKGQEKIQEVIPAERIAEKYRNIQKPEIPKFEREDEKA